MKYYVILFSLILIGCENTTPIYQLDPELRRTIFKECLELIPKGPTHTKYNDWDEVVETCGTEAYYQAQICVKNCLEK